MLNFGTLGPTGTNHELVTRRYLDFHHLVDSKLSLFDSFFEAVTEILDGKLDYVVENAVHPETPAIVGRFYREIFIVDCFISPGKPLAVVTRRDRQPPRSIALLHPSTTSYTDTSRWPEQKHITTGGLPFIAKGLLDGDYDSGLVYREVAEHHPDILKVDEELDSPDDAWLVLGRERTYTSDVLAWRDAPVTKQFQRYV
jgi:hypothetical protein